MKILILAYHFDPLNIIAAHRPNALVKYGYLYGLEATVITNQWPGKRYRKSKVHLEKDRKGTYYYLKIEKTFFGRLISVVNRIPIIRRIAYFIEWLLGFLDITEETFNSYIATRKFLRNLMRKESFDLVLAIYSPIHNIRLASYFARKYKVPFVADFRDLPDNRVMDESFQPVFAESLRISLYKRYLNKWLASCLAVTSTSQEWADYLATISGVKGYEIRNGFDAELIQKNTSELDREKFQLTSMGAIHSQQDLTLLLEVLKEFLFKNSQENIAVNFIGISQFYTPHLKKQLTKLLPENVLTVTPRIPHDEAISLMKNSQILVFPTPLNVKGFFTGKIFDYLAVERPILSFPGGNECTDNLIRVSKAGIICRSKKEILKYLQEAYTQWEKDGEVKYWGIPEVIQAYSREKQVERFALLIEKKLVNE